MPLDRRAMGRDHFAFGYLHALAVERHHLELAALGPLDEGTNSNGVIRGEREQPRIKRPVMSTAQREAVARIVGAARPLVIEAQLIKSSER